MFEGLCQDIYTEFFIQQQTDLMICRQRDYWSRGYYMLEEAVPGFLQGYGIMAFIHTTFPYLYLFHILFSSLFTKPFDVNSKIPLTHHLMSWKS
jgi:hypothetical protein